MSNQSTKDLEHDEIVSMLPWFVNQTLDGTQRDTVSRHIENCDECQREVQFLFSLRGAVQGDAQNKYRMDGDVEKDLTSVMNRIDAEKKPINAVVSAPSMLLRKLGNIVGLSSVLPNAQWSATALAGLLVVVLGFYLYHDQSDSEYSVLSSGEVNESSMQVAVEFGSAIDQEQARSLIQSELEIFGQNIDIQTKVDDVYVIVFRDAVSVNELSKLIVELENDELIKHVEVLP